ncbi:hypothetical protein [Moorena sp. SIOASIH]|nr:hypothetical protein [Moorena sp. SIOASIH]
MGETTAVAHGAWVCVRNLRPHRCLPRGNHRECYRDGDKVRKRTIAFPV